MTDDEIIVNQARKIAELEEKLDRYEQSRIRIRQILYSIGAPLNDNMLDYSEDQLKPFFRIAEETE